MRQQENSKIIVAPIISEKSTFLSEQQGRFVFKVKNAASKKRIKQAIEQMFEVEVESVNVLNVKGKTKKFGRFVGTRSNWKKAYIKLKVGHNIDLQVV